MNDALAELRQYAEGMAKRCEEDNFYSGRNGEDTELHQGRAEAYRDIVAKIDQLAPWSIRLD